MRPDTFLTRLNPLPTALGIVAVYVVLAALWIAFSDSAVGQLFEDRSQIVLASTLKGWLFVAVTGLLLFLLINKLLRRIAWELEQQSVLKAGRLQALQLLEAIANSSDDAIFAKDRQGRYLVFNRAAGEFVGKAPNAVLGLDDTALFPPEQAAQVQAADRSVIVGDRVVTQEERLTIPLGERVFLATKGPLRNEAGEVIGTFGISRDITERKAAEDALRDHEEKLAAIVGNSPSALSLKTPDGRYALANPNLQHLLGLREADILGKTDGELFPATEARTFRANDELVLRSMTRHSLEEEVSVGGRSRVFMSHMFPVLGTQGEARYICRISLDITERKQSEAEKERLASDLAATLRAIPDLLFEMDATGRYLRVEASAPHLLAAPADSLVGRTAGELLPPAAAETVMAALGRAAITGTDYGATITLPLAHGKRHFELSVARKQAIDPRFIVLSRDVTVRYETELELRRNLDELERFNAEAVGRELAMIALKRQINALHQELGRPPLFDLAFANEVEP